MYNSKLLKRYAFLGFLIILSVAIANQTSSAVKNDKAKAAFAVG